MASSLQLDAAVDVELETDILDGHGGFRRPALIAFEVTLGQLLAHGFFDLALSGDPQGLEELADAGVEDVLVHDHLLRFCRLEFGQDGVTYGRCISRSSSSSNSRRSPNASMASSSLVTLLSRAWISRHGDGRPIRICSSTKARASASDVMRRGFGVSLTTSGGA